MNMRGFSQFKNNSSKEKLVTFSEWPLKIVNEFGHFSADTDSIKQAKTPYFLKISKIREAIYFPEGVFSLWDYKEWHNTLYKAGYTESLAQTDNQLLLTLGELEAVGRFFRDIAFATSSRRRISIEMAMSQVSLNRLIDTELIPRPTLPSLPPHPHQS